MGEISVLQIPLAGGLDEKTAKEWNDPAKQQGTIVNGSFIKVGSISKRLGIKHLPNTLVPGSSIPAIDSGVRATSWSRSDLTVMSESGMYTNASAEGGLVGISSLPDVLPIRRPVVTAPTRTVPTVLDFPYNKTTLRVTIFYDTVFNLQATVYDADTGDIVLEPIVIYNQTGTVGAGQIPRVISTFYIPVGPLPENRARIFVLDMKDNSVWAINYDPILNVFSAPVNFLTFAGSFTGTGVIDIVPFLGDPAGTYVASSILVGTGGTTYRIQRFDPDSDAGLATTDQAMPAGEVLIYPTYGVCTWGERCWFFYTTFKGADSTFRHYAVQTTGDATLTIDGGTPLLLQGASTVGRFPGGACRLSATEVFYLIQQLNVTNDGAGGAIGIKTVKGIWYRLKMTGALAVDATGQSPLGYRPTCRPFVARGQVYQTFNLNLFMTATTHGYGVQSNQITCHLMKYVGVTTVASTINSPNLVFPVCTIAPRQGDENYQLVIDTLAGWQQPYASNGYNHTSQRHAVGLKTKGNDIAAKSGANGPAWVTDFYTDSDSRRQLYQATELGTELSFSSGVPFIADGQMGNEDSYFYYPEFSHAFLTGGGSVLPAGDYTYAICYAYLDAAGLVHRSAPAYTNKLTVPGDGTGPRLRITPLSATFRDALKTSIAQDGAVYAEIYRTLKDGSSFYFMDRIVVSNVPNLNAVIWPTSGTPPTPSIDGVPDSDLATSTLLYTTGGVLDHVDPPAAAFQTTHRGRKALVDETLRFVWFSKAFSQGTAPGFNEALVVPFSEGGDITAIYSMDDKFIVWKYSSIWMMTGDGPGDTGQGSDWSTPQSVSSDVGCVDWRSVVDTPVGIIFKAANGFYLLSRGLQVTFIGTKVIDLATTFPVVTSATLVPNYTQVRFTCSTEDGTASCAIVYDYLLSNWTRYNYNRFDAPIASGTLSYQAPQKYTLITTDGKIWQERLGTDAAKCMDSDSADVNHFVPTSITVPWTKIQVQGYQRVKRVQVLCEQEDNCGLQLDFSFNYDDTIKQTQTWNSTEMSQLAFKGLVETYVAAAYNKQMSVMVKMTDLPGSAMTTGAGMRFASVAFELEKLGDRFPQIQVLGRG